MLFQVVGDRGEGMVTVEAVKHRGGLVVNLLCVDTLASPGRPSQLVLVTGSADKLGVRGTLRGFLQTERAQYIPQVAVQTDDDRLAEQERLPEPEGAGEAGEPPAGAAEGAPQGRAP